MRSDYFDAVVIHDNPNVYCLDCFKKNFPEIDINSEQVCPIFADSEWDAWPNCDVCGKLISYPQLTEEGIKYHKQHAHLEVVAAMEEHGYIE